MLLFSPSNSAWPAFLLTLILVPCTPGTVLWMRKAACLPLDVGGPLSCYNKDKVKSSAHKAATIALGL